VYALSRAYVRCRTNLALVRSDMSCYTDYSFCRAVRLPSQGSYPRPTPPINSGACAAPFQPGSMTCFPPPRRSRPWPLFCHLPSDSIASRWPVAYPLDSSHHACHTSGGNTPPLARRVGNIVGPAISASSSEPDAVDVNNFASVSLNVFTNALAVHSWPHEHDKYQKSAHPNHKQYRARVTHLDCP
jgi:hypothetical protein